MSRSPDSTGRSRVVALIPSLLLATQAAALTVGPQVPLAPAQSYTLAGDYAAAGVGARNRGGGTIDLTLPPGAVVVQAFLYWTILDGTQPPATGTFNDSPVAGTLVAQAGDPCWPNQNAALEDPPTLFAWVYRADVTGLATSGENTIGGFPSLLTGGEDPLDPEENASAFPLFDGATLLAIYALPGAVERAIVVHEGGETFLGQSSTTAIDFGPSGATAPVSARTAFIVADGQAAFGGDQALFNGMVVAGPGAATKPDDAFDGADGGGPAEPQGVWDTLDLDVSPLVSPGATSATAGVVSGEDLDCLTWVAQVLSVSIGTTTTTTTVPTTITTTTTATTTTAPSTTTSTTATTITTTTDTVPTTTTLEDPTTTTTTTPEEPTTTTTTLEEPTTTTTVPDTTTTTVTTTSTTTVTTSTTTTAAPATTTTTLAPACDQLTGFAALLCRLDALRDRLLQLEPGRVRDALLARVRRAREHVEKAEERAAAGRTRAAGSKLKAAARILVSFGYRVDSLAGRGVFDEVLRAELDGAAAALRADMVALRGAL
jgi:hypothetical protein